MAQCAELYFTTSLTRTESRGWHFREDFPHRDDDNWRRWIDLELRDGALSATTTRIPYERFKTQAQPNPWLYETMFAAVR